MIMVDEPIDIRLHVPFTVVAQKRITKVFFYKQKTTYEMRISDWSSDVCSSDLVARRRWRATALGTSCRLIRFLLSLPARHHEIGRASCRERVCQYVSISVVAVSVKTQNITPDKTHTLVYQSSVKTKMSSWHSQPLRLFVIQH